MIVLLIRSIPNILVARELDQCSIGEDLDDQTKRPDRNLATLSCTAINIGEDAHETDTFPDAELRRIGLRLALSFALAGRLRNRLQLRLWFGNSFGHRRR